MEALRHIRPSRAASAVSLGLAALSLLLAGPARAQTGALENPADLSPQSGIGVISGWVCDAETVTLTIDGSLVLEAAYGTPRGDTVEACGDADNGFGLLWNFNLFGDGAHTIVAAADGEEFAAATFTVATIGAPFETGFSGVFSFAGFPTAGGAITLLWQKSSQNFVLVPPGTEVEESLGAAASASGASGRAASARVEAPAAATGTLENPDSFVSGIWLFSGWVCEASQVTLLVDGTQEIIPAYGTPRGDTVETCGDADNGFGVLWNFNLFGEGEHTVEAFADGMKFGEKTFVVTGFDTNFLRDAEGSFRLEGFPGGLEDTFVRWSEAAQNFVIWAKTLSGEPTPTPAPIPTPSPKPSPTAGGSTPTPTPVGPTPTVVVGVPSPTPSPTPTSGGGLCGNGVIDPGEECDGANLNGYTCDSAYLFGDEPDVVECQGLPLACDPDCTFNAENTDACLCACEEDLDCAFPDDPEGIQPPIGIDCTLLWCDKGVCPCDHLLPDDEFADCIDANTFPETQPNASIRASCDLFASCVDDVGCFIGLDLNDFYLFSTFAGICGEASNGLCDTDVGFYLSDEAAKRALCLSFDTEDFHRCTSYCDDSGCDCSDPNNIQPYNPDTFTCS